MADNPSPFHIGTAGWIYDDWKGAFYPQSTPGKFNFLSYYARYFNMVEVNSTFYAVMLPTLAEKWCKDVAERPDFLFSMKLWQGLTHTRPEQLPMPEINQIRSMARIFLDQGKLGAILLQFPWSFRFLPENVDYLCRLIDTFRDFPLAVEVRHSTWANEDAYDLLRQHSVAFCNIDQPQLHDCLPPSTISTAPFSYLRIHGRNAPQWFNSTSNDERYNYFYSPEEIEQITRMANALAIQTNRVMVTTNNHYHGKAAANALMLREALEGEAERIPEELVESFPVLQNVRVAHKDRKPEKAQLDLFG